MKIAEFFVGMFFDGNEGDVKNFDNSLQGLQNTIDNLKVAAAVAAVERLANATVMATAEIRNFQSQTNVSIDDLQRFQTAANMANVSLSFDEVANSVKSVQQNLAAIRLGEGDVSAYQMLGIDVMGKGPMEVIEEVRLAIRGLDDATATNLIQRIGLSPDFMKVLRMSREEFEALAASGFLSEEQRQKIDRLGVSMASMKREIRFLSDQMISTFQPVLKAVADFVTGMAEGFNAFAEQIEKTEGAVQLLVAALALLLLKFKPIVLAFGAILLAAEDLAAYFRGDDSVFGVMIEKAQLVYEYLEKFILNPLEKVQNALGFGKLGELMFGDDFDLGETMGGLTNSIGGSIRQTVSNVFNINSNADAKEIADDVVGQQQRVMNHSLADINNGALN